MRSVKRFSSFPISVVNGVKSTNRTDGSQDLDMINKVNEQEVAERTLTDLKWICIYLKINYVHR